MINHRGIRFGRRLPRQVSLGVVVVVSLLAFIAGNRLAMVGDWFFAPYTNKGNQALSQNLDYTEIEQLYDLLKQKYDGQLDNLSLQDGLKKGLVEAAGDDYTNYLTAGEAQEFNDDLNGSFNGIGAELGKRQDNLVVITPLDNSPAEKAGLQAGDTIAMIEGEDAARLSIDEAVSKIRGPVGSHVKLGLIRDNQPLELTIERAHITVPSVESEIIDGIGYLKITRFSDDTAQLAQQAAAQFKAQAVRGVVVDLRNNGGGLVDTAVKLGGLWLDKQVVVEEREGNQVKAKLRSPANPPLAGVPTIVLINQGSASASEILAGALRDHRAARLFGEQTFGKGSVQELIDLPSGAKLKVTVARWYTPAGNTIDQVGITPDVVIEQNPADSSAQRDPQKDQALQALR